MTLSKHTVLSHNPAEPFATKSKTRATDLRIPGLYNVNAIAANEYLQLAVWNLK
jgi:hypothetical protein